MRYVAGPRPLEMVSQSSYFSRPLPFILKMLTYILSLTILIVSVIARPPYSEPQPFARALKARQAVTNTTGLQVDLGYAIYQGQANSTTNLNTFRGQVSAFRSHPIS